MLMTSTWSEGLPFPSGSEAMSIASPTTSVLPSQPKTRYA